MNYLLMNGTVLGVVAIVMYAFLKRLPKRVQGQAIGKPFWLTMLGMLLLTAMFDSFIVAAGIVGYDTTRILGIYIGRAPIEDFAYTAVSVMLVVIIWEYYEYKR